MKLSMRIRIARQRARFSQEALALNLGVTRSAVANWECIDNVLPASARLAKLAELTGVSYEWLATGRGTIGYACGDGNVPVVDGEMVYDELECRLLDAFSRMRPAMRLQTLLRLEAGTAPSMKAGNKTRG